MSLQKYQEDLSNNFFKLEKFFVGGDFFQVAICLNNIGLIYLNLKKYHRALTYFNSALTFFFTLNKDLNRTLTLVNIADLYKKQGRDSLALKNYMEALTLSEDIKWFYEDGKLLKNYIINNLKAFHSYSEKS